MGWVGLQGGGRGRGRGIRGGREGGRGQAHHPWGHYACSLGRAGCQACLPAIVRAPTYNFLLTRPAPLPTAALPTTTCRASASRRCRRRMCLASFRWVAPACLPARLLACLPACLPKCAHAVLLLCCCLCVCLPLPALCCRRWSTTARWSRSAMMMTASRTTAWSACPPACPPAPAAFLELFAGCPPRCVPATLCLPCAVARQLALRVAGQRLQGCMPRQHPT